MFLFNDFFQYEKTTSLQKFRDTVAQKFIKRYPFLKLMKSKCGTYYIDYSHHIIIIINKDVYEDITNAKWEDILNKYKEYHVCIVRPKMVIPHKAKIILQEKTTEMYTKYDPIYNQLFSDVCSSVLKTLLINYHCV